MRESFGENTRRIPLPETRSFEGFKEKIKGWMTTPEGVDYCPFCWAVAENTRPLLKKAKNAARPTVEIAEQRKGTDAWYVACQKCDREVEVFVAYAKKGAP